jgi:hypothetical protein
VIRLPETESRLSSRVTPQTMKSGAREGQQRTPFPVWKALLGLLVFDVLKLGRNFARLHHLVSKWRVAPRRAIVFEVDRVCQAINYACVWYPKRVQCLQRSAVTTCLLRTCGVSAEMVMGAQTLPFKAHAWTEVNGRAINERRDVQKIYGAWDRC